MKIKKIISVVVMLGISTISFSNAFSDLGKEHWAYEEVETMTSKGIITGYTDGTFKPEKSVTREEFATILTKTLELDSSEEVVKFEDVSNDRWSKKYIDASSRYLTGYTIKGNYYFYPEEMAVREDMAVAVVKANKLDNQEPDYSVLNKFSDKDAISAGLEKYIAIAVKNGIMNGNTNGTFNPKGALTRAEITALMCNVLEKVVIDDEIEHSHELDTKITYKNTNKHTVKTYCRSCGENISEKTETHKFSDGKCICGAMEVVENIINIKEALNKAQLKGKELDTNSTGTYESFVIYNMALKSAEVEIYDSNNKKVSCEGQVATEFDTDAVKKDIKSVRIRIPLTNLEAGETYTVYVNDVITKAGEKVEDYEFSFTTKNK